MISVNSTKTMGVYSNHCNDMLSRPASPHHLTAVPFLRSEVSKEKHPVAMELAGQVGPVVIPFGHDNNHNNHRGNHQLRIAIAQSW